MDKGRKMPQKSSTAPNRLTDPDHRGAEAALKRAAEKAIAKARDMELEHVGGDAKAPADTPVNKSNAPAQ